MDKEGGLEVVGRDCLLACNGLKDYYLLTISFVYVKKE